MQKGRERRKKLRNRFIIFFHSKKKKNFPRIMQDCLKCIFRFSEAFKEKKKTVERKFSSRNVRTLKQFLR